jgi:tetratricopeptide (TPR) repeat protein
MERAAALAGNRSGLVERIGDFHLRRWTQAADPLALAEALPFYRRAAGRDPDRLRSILERLSAAGLDAGDWHRVVSPDARSRRELARRLMAAERHELAAELLEKLALALPGDVEVMEWQSSALLHTGRVEEGLSVLSARVRSSSDGDRALERAWPALRAIPVERRALFLDELESPGWWRRVLLARTRLDDGDAREAMRGIDMVLREDPRDEAVLLACYDLRIAEWTRREWWQQAAEPAEKAAEIQPTMQRWRTVARIRERAGDTVGALQAWKRALTLADASGRADEIEDLRREMRSGTEQGED